MDQPNREIIAKAISETMAGNTDSYTVIVTAYMQKLYTVALSVCRNSSEAEDLVQETLIDAYLHLSSLRDPEKIEGWLMRILKNKTFNHLARTRYAESDMILQNLCDRRTPESIYMARENLREWQSRIDTLTPALRKTAKLYFLQNLSMETIARRTKVPLGTVKRRIHDAREKLRKENHMTNENQRLPDAFAEELAKKLRDLENYANIHRPRTFDTAYSNVKKLISNLSHEDDVKSYSIQSAYIASSVDPDKYSEEALEIYKKYDDVRKAAELLHDLLWRIGGREERLNYILNTAIPTLAEYPESEFRTLEIGRFKLHALGIKNLAELVDVTEARVLLDDAMAHFSGTELVYSPISAAIGVRKALDILASGKKRRFLPAYSVTILPDGDNLKGCYEEHFRYLHDGVCARFQNWVFDAAYQIGDWYFFPRTVPLEDGAEEEIGDKGFRRVVSTRETVETHCGTFTDCLHIEYGKKDTMVRGLERVSDHIWYKKGVGIVKVATDDPRRTRELSSYDIKGGEGYLPLAIGNKWTYTNTFAPEFITVYDEFVIERHGTNIDFGEAWSLSAVNCITLEDDWEESCEDPSLILFDLAEQCRNENYDTVAQKLRKIIMDNQTRESVDVSLAILPHIEERMEYQAKNWPALPSYADIEKITVKENTVKYGWKNEYQVFHTGKWSMYPKGELTQNERFISFTGVFRILKDMCDNLWDDRWKIGYTEEKKAQYYDGTIKLSADEGGTVQTPAGFFEDTMRLTVDYDYMYFSNRNYEAIDKNGGRIEIYFAKGVGVVRCKITMDNNITSDVLLTSYNTVSAPDEMMPIHIGNRWIYEEQNLTAENYIARRDFKILSGQNENYLLSNNLTFTWRGTVDEYEEWKKNCKTAQNKNVRSPEK